METVKIKLSLKIADTQAREEALQDLERWLKAAGFPVELCIELPAEGEQGLGITGIVVFLMSSILHESLGPLIHEWERDHPHIPPVEQVHIDVREPEPPPPKEKNPVITVGSPPDPPIKKV